MAVQLDGVFISTTDVQNGVVLNDVVFSTTSNVTSVVVFDFLFSAFDLRKVISAGDFYFKVKTGAASYDAATSGHLTEYKIGAHVLESGMLGTLLPANTVIQGDFYFNVTSLNNFVVSGDWYFDILGRTFVYNDWYFNVKDGPKLNDWYFTIGSPKKYSYNDFIFDIVTEVHTEMLDVQYDYTGGSGQVHNVLIVVDMYQGNYFTGTRSLMIAAKQGAVVRLKILNIPQIAPTEDCGIFVSIGGVDVVGEYSPLAVVKEVTFVCP